jgi:hypothetical protein
VSYKGRLKIVECDAKMKASHVRKARRRLEENDAFIESSFLDTMQNEADALLDDDEGTSFIEVPKDRCWFSGNYVGAETIAPIASLIVGRLSGYFVGEDGNLYGGFRIEDGTFTKCNVTVTLVPQQAGSK